jgi:hypothetical protein
MPRFSSQKATEAGVRRARQRGPTPTVRVRWRLSLTWTRPSAHRLLLGSVIKVGICVFRDALAGYIDSDLPSQ